MAQALPTTTVPNDREIRPTPAPWQEFAAAPLVPPVCALTIGLCVDRYYHFALEFGVGLVLVGFAAWCYFRNQAPRYATTGLLAVWCGLGFLHHQIYRNRISSDDVSCYLAEKPQFLRMRGVLLEEPTINRVNREDPLVPGRKLDRGSAILGVTQLSTLEGSWVNVSGRVRMSVERDIDPLENYALNGLRIGDELEVIGFGSHPRGPSNPGERDWAYAEYDHRIHTELNVGKGKDVITRLRTREGFSWEGMWAQWRGLAVGVITNTLPEGTRPVAQALLLGDGQAMARTEWDGYVRTGVVHVLAISGQHLVVLAGFVWFLGRVANMRGRYVALVAVAIVLGYAFLTGLRPSALRAAVMVASVGAGFALRRPVMPANTLALAWLLVAAIDPTDIFTAGNLLSFLSVFVLIWGAGRWLRAKPQSNLERLLEQTQPAFIRYFHKVLAFIKTLYLVNTILFVANAPLIVDRQNLISPVALLLGPPLVVLASAALLAGFLMLIIGAVSSTIAWPFAVLTSSMLGICGKLVKLFDSLPGGIVYLPAPPLWWLVGFYAILISTILLGVTGLRRGVLALGVWVLVGIVPSYRDMPPDEVRVTFVAVGHGTCAVVECPDGRVLLYDTGSMGGPDIVRHSVAPYLWHRRIRRIDEVFLSHADGDHYNGLAELLKRFPVGQVTMTPSFAEKATPEVDAILLAIQKAKVPIRIVTVGDVLVIGDVRLEVLHPPKVGPAGTENERSLVLLLHYANQKILFTGDLEKSGTTLVTKQPAVKADVVMAPHHGSRPAYSRSFQDWAGGRFVIVSKGTRNAKTVGEEETGSTVTVWETATKGAITIRLHKGGIVAEAFRTKEITVVKQGSK